MATVTVKVDVSVSDGTATVGSDYGVFGTATLTFAPGESSKSVVVEVLGDTVPEYDETLIVSLSNASGAGLVDEEGVGTIVDDGLILAPAGVIATASSETTVAVTWAAAAKAAAYQVFRSTSGFSYAHVGTTAATSFDDITASAGTAYLYAVKAVDAGGGGSAYSAPDLATTVIFTDPTVTPGVTMAKAAHVEELRGGVR